MRHGPTHFRFVVNRSRGSGRNGARVLQSDKAMTERGMRQRCSQGETALQPEQMCSSWASGTKFRWSTLAAGRDTSRTTSIESSSPVPMHFHVLSWIPCFLMSLSWVIHPLFMVYLSRSLSQGKMLHTRNHKNEIPLENATEIPLEHSSGNPLDKWQSFGTYHWQVNIRWKMPLTIWQSVEKCHWQSTMISEVSISGVQSFAPTFPPCATRQRALRPIYIYIYIYRYTYNMTLQYCNSIIVYIILYYSIFCSIAWLVLVVVLLWPRLPTSSTATGCSAGRTGALLSPAGDIYIYIYIHMYVCMYIYIYIHTHVYIYIYI